jgi:two-component system, LuxR family, sensor histidine kinase DctS
MASPLKSVQKSEADQQRDAAESAALTPNPTLGPTAQVPAGQKNAENAANSFDEKKSHNLKKVVRGDSDPGPAWWTVLTVLALGFLSAVGVLLWFAIQYERQDQQSRLDEGLKQTVAQLRTQMLRDSRDLQLMATAPNAEKDFDERASRWFADKPALVLIELQTASRTRTWAAPRSDDLARRVVQIPNQPESVAAAELANGRGEPAFSSSYFVPLQAGAGVEVLDLTAAVNGSDYQRLRVVYSLVDVLTAMVSSGFMTRQELSFREADGTVLAWAGRRARGKGIYRASAVLDLPGTSLMLSANSIESEPSLIPNLLVAAVIALATALLVSLLRLVKDIRRRARAESQLREQFTFRKAMEDSLLTGLRARALDGTVTYVNPAFCSMVGFSADELVGRSPPMPYWAPEVTDEYERRFAQVLAGTISTKGFETIYCHHDGRRFPVLIYEAPLIDASGRQTGWLSSVLDLSERREFEASARQQQERLEHASRLGTMGEIASMLSHELNQPLSAISSYASGAQHVLNSPEPIQASSANYAQLKLALDRIAGQAQRAGQVIRSVHDFVRRRDRVREPVDLVALLETVRPLISLQARSAQTELSLETKLNHAWVDGDLVLLEQVILNLTRNSFQALQANGQLRSVVRVELAFSPLDLSASDADLDGSGAEYFQISVIDSGPGVDSSLTPQLFSKFVTTKPDGMGIGLNICRSVIEQHGGRLWHEPTHGGGATFRFALRARNVMSNEIIEST